MYKILLVEDDSVIADAMERQICSWGYEIQRVRDFHNILDDFLTFAPHLVLLDISLPFFNGYYWCGEIRKISKVPILFISSAADNMNIVMAVNMGGDDFLAKPFDMEVLTAKVQALLRRSYDFAGQQNVLACRGVLLDLNDASLSYNDQRIELTKNDFRILQTLMEHPGKTVSRDTLMTRLWQTDSYIDENTLTVNITRLRRKLESAGLQNFIQTKKGMGYLVE